MAAISRKLCPPVGSSFVFPHFSSERSRVSQKKRRARFEFE